MSASGTVVVDQTVDGLPTSTTSREGGRHRSEVPGVTKKSARKRRNPIYQEEGTQVEMLLEALRDDSICNLDSQATSNFELVWASSNLPSKNVTLKSDHCKNLLKPIYDLGCLGRSCIVPRCELLDLIIPLDSAAQSLDLFWGTIVGEFYDPLLAINMFRVILFRPWGTFNIPEAVVKLVDENMDMGRVSEVQLSNCNLRTPSPSSNDTSPVKHHHKFPMTWINWIIWN